MDNLPQESGTVNESGLYTVDEPQEIPMSAIVADPILFPVTVGAVAGILFISFLMVQYRKRLAAQRAGNP